MSNQYLNFNVNKSDQKSQMLIVGRQGDNILKFVTVSLWDNDLNKPYDLTGKNIIFEGEKPDGSKVIDTKNAILLNPSKGLFRYTLTDILFSASGIYKQAFFKITHLDKNSNEISDSTLDFKINVESNSVEFGINSESYISEYEDLISSVKQKFIDFENTVNSDVEKVQDLHQDIDSLINKINQNQVITPIDTDENISVPIQLLLTDFSSATKPLGYQDDKETNNLSDLSEYGMLIADGGFIQITNTGWEPNPNILINTLNPDQNNLTSINGKEPLYDASDPIYFSNGETKLTYSGIGEFFYRFNKPIDNDLGNLLPGTMYTFSAEISSDTEVSFRWQIKTANSSWNSPDNSLVKLDVNSIYSRKSATFVVPEDATAIYISIQANNPMTGSMMAFKRAKLEIGDKDTGYINGGPYGKTS